MDIYILELMIKPVSADSNLLYLQFWYEGWYGMTWVMFTYTLHVWMALTHSLQDKVDHAATRMPIMTLQSFN